MKKILSVILIASLVLSLLSGCSFMKDVEQDDSPITMFVGLGNGKDYYYKLQQLIKEKLNINVEFIYQSAVDTTTALKLEFKNNDLPADIICTASVTDPDWAKDSCLDLMSYSHLSDHFTIQKIDEYINEDGTIYQLPFTSRLVGITYNKTLMEENGWEVPNTYQEMLDLKQKCDEKGILFAVSANVATGHGFNYLFHTMGTEWISTLKGTEWFENFIEGKVDATELGEQAGYFVKWVENGLFGNIHYQDWSASAEYCGKRALFFYDLTNSVYSYQGEMIDENGNGTGVMLNDEYASMPWISYDGTNNCYTYYDCMFVAINKKLGESNQKDRLEKVLEILEFMTTEDATKIFTETYPDGYVAVNTFEIDESRNYYKFKDAVENGYMMPWYYGNFDTNTIVNTGEAVNNYLRGEGESIDNIISVLETSYNDSLNNSVEILTTFSKDFTYEETAKLNAIGAVISLQDAYDENEIGETVSAALVPYVEKVEDFSPFTAYGAISTRAYKGELEKANIQTIISAKGQKVMGIRMTGKKLLEIAEAGVTDGDVVYPYALIAKEEIQEDKIYVVAVSSASLNQNYKDEFTESGAIISNDGNNITTLIEPGLVKFLSKKENVGPSDLTF